MDFKEFLKEDNMSEKIYAIYDSSNTITPNIVSVIKGEENAKDAINKAIKLKMLSKTGGIYASAELVKDRTELKRLADNVAKYAKTFNTVNDQLKKLWLRMFVTIIRNIKY